MIYPELLTRYPLISDQVSVAELRVILRELEKAVTGGVEGDVVEFGCYSGTTSLFIRRLLDAYDDHRAFHAYDSFAGLPPKTLEDKNAAGLDFKAGELAVSKKQFLRNFERAKLQPPITHKAWFNELTNQDVPAEIGFAFLDGDFYESIQTSLELVWSRLTKDAVVLVHDYNRETLPGVAQSVTDFLQHYHLHPQLQVEANIGILRPAKVK